MHEKILPKSGELRNLNHETLTINGLGSEVDACEAEKVQLKKKIGLHTLVLWFEEWDDEETIREKDVLVLNALEQPPPNLEYLRIGCYKGSTIFPNSMMSLINLKKLDINFLCIEHLPPLGKLPLLESFRIECNDRLKKVGVEFMGIEGSKREEKDDIIITVFPNLKSLIFFNLIEWEEWNGIGGGEEEEEDYIRRFTIMPRLHELSIGECLKLKSLPNFLHTTPLQELNMNNCTILKQRYKRGIGEKWPKISHIPNIIVDDYKYV